MYKDFKKSESLDTGFVGGSGILWMMSGIILGLVVGLGMYYFSNNNNSSISLVESVQQKIEKAQHSKPTQYQQNITTKTKNTQRIKSSEQQARKNSFSYYAVLPTLDVPVNSLRPIDTRQNINTSTKKSITEGSLIKVSTKNTNDNVEVSSQIGDYLLQVASFKKKSMANLTRGRLANKGIEAYVQKKKVKGRFWYRVVAGPVDQISVDNWKITAEKLGHRPLIISVR
ncbi:MAG: SPOR domain-containing protein [Cocleimonas sp.]